MSSIPNTQTNLTEFYIGLVHMINFLLFMTDQISQLISVVCIQLLFAFGLMSLVYAQEMTLIIILIKIAMAFATFVVGTLVSMMLLYIFSMHSR